MTKQDFEALALILRTEGASEACIFKIASYLCRTQPNFHQPKFLELALPERKTT